MKAPLLQKKGRGTLLGGQLPASLRQHFPVAELKARISVAQDGRLL